MTDPTTELNEQIESDNDFARRHPKLVKLVKDSAVMHVALQELVMETFHRDNKAAEGSRPTYHDAMGGRLCSSLARCYLPAIRCESCEHNTDRKAPATEPPDHIGCISPCGWWASGPGRCQKVPVHLDGCCDYRNGYGMFAEDYKECVRRNAPAKEPPPAQTTDADLIDYIQARGPCSADALADAFGLTGDEVREIARKSLRLFLSFNNVSLAKSYRNGPATATATTVAPETSGEACPEEANTETAIRTEASTTPADSQDVSRPGEDDRPPTGTDARVIWDQATHGPSDETETEPDPEALAAALLPRQIRDYIAANHEDWAIGRIAQAMGCTPSEVADAIAAGPKK